MRIKTGGKVRLAVVAAMVTAAMTVALGGMIAGASSNGGNILPKVGNSTPVTGGTLKIVGSGDVDHLDTCCAYYTTTYEMLRMVSRQLVSYKASYAGNAAGTRRSPTSPPTRSARTASPTPSTIKHGRHVGHPDRPATGDRRTTRCAASSDCVTRSARRHRSPIGPTTSPG